MIYLAFEDAKGDGAVNLIAKQQNKCTANEMIVRMVVRIFPYYHAVCTSLVCMFQRSTNLVSKGLLIPM